MPVSTTHTITGAIVGVGAAQRLSAVRWGVATRIVWAWILTIPMAAAIAAVCYLGLRRYVGGPDPGPARRSPPDSPPAADRRRTPVPRARGGQGAVGQAAAEPRVPQQAAQTVHDRRRAVGLDQPRVPLVLGELHHAARSAATSDGSPEPIASSSELPKVSVDDGNAKMSADA